MAVFHVEHRAPNGNGISRPVVAASAEDAIQMREIELAGEGLELVECRQVAETGSRYEQLLIETDEARQRNLLMRGFSQFRRRLRR